MVLRARPGPIPARTLERLAARPTCAPADQPVPPASGDVTLRGAVATLARRARPARVRVRPTGSPPRPGASPRARPRDRTPVVPVSPHPTAPAARRRVAPRERT
ncbi:hypothetical protein FTX61_11620 [Nitriliruptoraceae bacterium ZYF776]|nr:hypothetical protein [Profundirhabdus halotolerans]